MKNVKGESRCFQFVEYFSSIIPKTSWLFLPLPNLEYYHTSTFHILGLSHFEMLQTIFAHGRDTSRDKTRHSPRLCLCVPQTLCTVHVRFTETQKCVGFLSISAEPWGPLSLKILLDEITLETYDRPGSKKYFAKLFIGLCS